MELTDVLSDKPIPARTETTESATDVKPAPVVEKTEAKPDPAASSAAKETKPETEAEKSKVEDSNRDRDDKGRFTKTVPQEALHAEKARRRELEQELQKLKAQPPAKPTSVLEDEDKAFAERLNRHTQPIIERFYKLSVKSARNAPGRTDYEEVAAAFQEAAEASPQLWDDFRNSDDPGEFVYSIGKQHKELGEVGGDILKYGEKKRAEGAAETEALKAKVKAMEAEIATLKTSKEKQEKVPQSLNGEQSATAKGSSFAGPTPLASILSS